MYLMNKRNALLTFFQLFILFSFCQTQEPSIYLKSGKLNLATNISETIIGTLNGKLKNSRGASVLIQFENLPTEAEKAQLATQGIQLLDYIPDNAYTVSISQPISATILKQVRAKSIYELKAAQKMEPSLAAGLWPSYAVKVEGTVDTWINYAKNFSAEEVTNRLKEMNIAVLPSELSAYHVLVARVNTRQLFQLAEQGFVNYLSPIPPPDQTLNQNSRSLSHATVLNSAVADGGKGLNGEGITAGIGDNADIQFHIDFKDRLINRAVSDQQGHGTHTSGILGGAGIVNELYRGYLPKATILSQSFTGIWLQASVYVRDYNMVVTNNSYGAAVGCDFNGLYTPASAMLDQQAFDMPHLQHVFAVGNSGTTTCAPYPQGFRTVLGAYQTAKNVLTVGATDLDGLIAVQSSSGPVRDGRLKPEITAQGISVFSTWPGNTYRSTGGTSMSSPAVAGGLGLLYQRYRQLHNNADPQSALMKALICNGAADKGNAGPDFKYGFGSMNLLRSVEMLEQDHYFAGFATNGSATTKSIAVPANTASLKVMLYWHDPAASMLASKSLVNDLDIEVTDPSSSTTLPLVPDSTVAHVNDAATTVADHTNNMEQVVLANPIAGNYSIRIKGTAIAQNPSQEYFVVYDIIPNSIKLIYPVGGDGLVPGETVRIAWDSFGDEASGFALQYSIDAGASWIDINNNVPAGTRFYSWQVPATATDKAMIRVVKNSSSQFDTTRHFTIIGQPVLSLAPTQCEGYIALNWNAVDGASDYEILQLKGAGMVPVAATAATSYTFNSYSKDSIYWLSVRARINGKWGRRSIAISRQPNTGSCSGTISDNDLKLNALISPVSGRRFTSTALGAVTAVQVEIKNLDDVPASNFVVKYSIDSGATWVTENVALTIAAGQSYSHAFATTADFSAPGNYRVIAVVTNSIPDAVTANDTLYTLVRHLDNQALNLSAAYAENMESSASAEYSGGALGLKNIERYDFQSTSSFGRLRTFVNSGVAYSGKNAITLDASRLLPSNISDFVTGTFNLSNYNAQTNAVRLDFKYKLDGLSFSESNQVWIRGNDSSPWISIYATNDGSLDNKYKSVQSLELSDSLVRYNQNFSTSFQIKWGREVGFPDHGMSLDDIRLYEAFNDAQVISVDTPYAFNCGLSNAVPIKITVRNSSRNILNNVPVKYSVNNGSWVTENIPVLNAKTTASYIFSAKADLFNPGSYTIKAVVDYATDNVRQNDTTTAVVQSIPLISSFPYLQNFENNNGGWYSLGFNNSWEYGVPASSKINKAASGTKAWKTRLSGNYNDEELSFLYSPCFDIAGLSNPALSFSMAVDVENCGTTACDFVWVDYSTNGQSWMRLAYPDSAGINWYNQTTDYYWSIENFTRWHVATSLLPKGLKNIRFRFGFRSDQAVNREGVAIDDIHVYDYNKAIYNGFTAATPISKTVSGNDWVHFEKDGKLVASIHPHNQDMGNTSVKIYINKNAVRYTADQYYHDRNLVINPSLALSDSASVRFYFLDSETDSLIKAIGCVACAKPASAYELGISSYHDYDTSFENGSIADNKQGLWSFINSSGVSIVPFDKGYYAEFKVKDFSEFWLNTGAISGSIPLPVKMLGFSIQKANKEDVSINWSVATETDVLRYEIEVARSTDEMQKNKFEKIGSVASAGPSTTKQQYGFLDTEIFKTGVRYYRLKTINQDGSYSYSVTRSLIFNELVEWQVIPNPSGGLFYFIYYMDKSEIMNMQLTDVTGRLLKNYSITGNATIQKQIVDISSKSFATGIYFLQVHQKGKMKVFKLYKQ